MKLIILIGPDTLGTIKYKNKQAARAALARLASKRVLRPDNVELTFLKRRYTQDEVKSAVVATLEQFFRLIKE